MDTFGRMDVEALKKRFASIYGLRPAGAVRAPGRVNLIGEHTDYNDGFVLPIAIERQTVALFAPRDDRTVNLISTQADAAGAINLEQRIGTGDPPWANYCKGVAAGLVERGVELVGADMLFDSDIPLGGGLSSSAALEVATALALLSAAGRTGAVSAGELARLCQKAEQEFAGAQCGIMDQSIVLMGRQGRAMLLDCRSGEVKHVPFDDPGVLLLVADTQVSHNIAAGGYTTRREQCHAATERLGVVALRDVDAQMLAEADSTGGLAGKELMRARHVVGEIARTLQAAEAIGAGDYERFGELMYASHASLRDDYEVSCAELDAIVELARRQQGVYGARMTGGGFGGCAIILIDSDRAEQITRAVSVGFSERFRRDCLVFSTHAGPGAGNL